MRFVVKGEYIVLPKDSLLNMMKTMSEDFADWLRNEMNSRAWSQAELSKRSGLAPSAVSNVLNRERLPGIDLCRKIAHALGMRDVDVIRRAGLASPELPPSDVRERVKRQLDQMSEEQLKVVERTARALLAEQLLESLRAEPQKPQTNPNRP